MKAVLYGNGEVDYCTEVAHAKSLRALGHTCEIIQENKVDTEVALAEGLKSDLFIWIHSHGFRNPGRKPMEAVLDELKAAGVPTVAFHLDLYQPLPARWAEYVNSPYMNRLQHFFTVDRLMADWLNANTETQGHYLPAGVLEEECYVNPDPISHANEVIFVGSRRYHDLWPWRGQLISWLQDTYGPRFTHVGGDGPTGTVRGDDLNRTYTNSKIAIGDSLCVGFDYPHYWSDRATETMGRNGFLIHPHITGMDDFYRDGEHLRYFKYGDFDQLKSLIDYYLDDANAWEANKIRAAGHMHVKNNHSYTQRWQSILDTVFGEQAAAA